MYPAPAVTDQEIADHNTMSDRILTLLDCIVNLISEITDILQEETRSKIANQASTIQATIHMQQLVLKSAVKSAAPSKIKVQNPRIHRYAARPVIRGSYRTKKSLSDR